MTLAKMLLYYDIDRCVVLTLLFHFFDIRISLLHACQELLSMRQSCFFA